MQISSKLILGAALMCLAGIGSAQTTNPDRPATTSDRPATTTPPASTTSPGTTSTSPSSSAVPAPSVTTESRTTTTERTYRDPVTGRMTSDPARMDSARAPRYDRN